MEEIQIDMFEVQLGASILIQFFAEDRTVTILADAGTSGGSYGRDHIVDKLQAILPSTEGHRARIDLLIGTHYDSDHLNRMVPVIEQYEIGEAWLPPVADDTAPVADEWEAPRFDDFIASKFAADDDGANFHRYMRSKAAQIQTILKSRQLLDQREGRSLDALLSADDASGEDLPESVDIEYFERRLAEADRFLSVSSFTDHAESDVRPPLDLSESRRESLWRWADRDLLGMMLAGRMSPKAAQRSLAYIEKSIAKGAITASFLNKVVSALKAKGVPMRFEYVPDGKPVHFRWNARTGMFVRARGRPETGTFMTLLGPSIGLIGKHWKRLPIGNYMALALKVDIPVENITPSNELSYSMVFTHADRRVLVTGDSGFVDFPMDPDADELEFHPALIAVLKGRLDVVQVAHHAGHNKYFYHALLDAGFDEQQDEAYLLLSHKPQDKHRPSDAFARFAQQLASAESGVRMLFTSEPRPAAVRTYRELIHPSVTPAAAAEVGDVRLVYSDGAWIVERHAIRAGD